MNALLSLLSASALGVADLAVLALVASRLGRGPLGGARALLLGLLVLAKLGLLALGVAFLAGRPWCDRHALFAGLLAPFAAFIAWQALSLRLRTRGARP